MADPRKVRTSDGYVFTEQPDGTWSDGDMTFNNLAEIQESDPDTVSWPDGGKLPAPQSPPDSPSPADDAPRKPRP